MTLCSIMPIMRTHLIVLVLLLSTVSLLGRLNSQSPTTPVRLDRDQSHRPATSQYSVDGIALGTSRADLERRLGSRSVSIRYFEDPNWTGWATSTTWSFAVGNHPEEFEANSRPQRTGYAYGTSGEHGLPLVGYDDRGYVSWVCGRRLSSGGSALKVLRDPRSPLGKATNRPGHCMEGACAWTFQQGLITVLQNNEQTSELFVLLGR